MKQIFKMDTGYAFLATIKVNFVKNESVFPKLPLQFAIGEQVVIQAGRTKLSGQIEGFGVSPMYQQHWSANGFPLEDEVWVSSQYKIRAEDGRTYKRFEIDLLPLNLPASALTATEVIDWLNENSWGGAIDGLPNVPVADGLEIPVEQIKGHPIDLPMAKTPDVPVDKLSAFSSFLGTLDIETALFSDDEDDEDDALKSYSYRVARDDINKQTEVAEGIIEAYSPEHAKHQLVLLFGETCFITHIRETEND